MFSFFRRMNFIPEKLSEKLGKIINWIFRFNYFQLLSPPTTANPTNNNNFRKSFTFSAWNCRVPLSIRIIWYFSFAANAVCVCLHAMNATENSIKLQLFLGVYVSIVHLVYSDFWLWRITFHMRFDARCTYRASTLNILQFSTLTLLHVIASSSFLWYHRRHHHHPLANYYILFSFVSSECTLCLYALLVQSVVYVWVERHSGELLTTYAVCIARGRRAREWVVSISIPLTLTMAVPPNAINYSIHFCLHNLSRQFMRCWA